MVKGLVPLLSNDSRTTAQVSVTLIKMHKD